MLSKIFVVCVSLLVSCGSVVAPLQGVEQGIDIVIKTRPQDLVAAVAVINENNSQELRLVLFDYYNPLNYEIVSDNTYNVEEPRISPDKSKVVFGDRNQYLHDAGYAFVMYDLRDKTFKQWNNPNPDFPPFLGIWPRWNTESTGFYYTLLDTWGYQNVLYFDVTTESGRLVSHGEGFISLVYCAGVINADTLIVSRADPLQSAENSAFYLMDTEGNNLSRLDNPHLIHVLNNGRVRKPRSLSWNSSVRLLAYTESYSHTEGYMVSVTNLDGTYYRNYTSGYSDRHPRWVPGQNKIIFVRKPAGVTKRQYGKIMVLDVETGGVSELFTPNMIKNCIGIEYLDF